MVDQLRQARGVGTPLVAITTPDPPATVAAILAAYASSDTPVVCHDLIRGMRGLNDAGRDAVTMIAPEDNVLGVRGPVLTSPAEALGAAANLPALSVLLVHNVTALLDNPAVVQAVCNCRDIYKANGRTLVLLDTAITLPVQLAQDVLMLDEALPDESQIRAIIDRELAQAIEGMVPPPVDADEPTKARAVAALTGLAAFPVEQAVAISLLSGKLDTDQLWNRKRALIQQTRGLSMDAGSLTFDMLGGLDEIKRHGRAIYAGPEPPAVIVRLDEIEKLMAGSRGDSSGTSQDQKGVILREMEDMGWTGAIFVGGPGTGKTAITQSIGNTFQVPTLSFDLGAAKDRLVGSSEGLIRQCMKVIRAIAGKDAYFVATCNDISNGVITPDLLRRFTDGIWYFDLCSAEEKAAIWPIHLAKYGHALDTKRPKDAGWTGAEIRNCCRLAYRRGCSVVEAAASIVPIAVADPRAIENLRGQANGRFLSASYPGTYKHKDGSAANVALPEGPLSIGTSGRKYGES